jgi:HAD superfamily hydrolase (TIGR01549 family)
LIKNILFDLDGTLLRMDMDKFMQAYFAELGKELAPYGYEKDALISAVWAGTKAMAKNDGTMPNEERFWQEFERLAGGDIPRVRESCNAFYRGNFHKARKTSEPVPQAREALKTARDKGMGVALATSPVFPRDGILARLEWAGLSPNDFDYISTYETERYSKPDPLYYIAFTERLGWKREECLMVGNDEKEDMYACTQAGIEGYLITDCLIPCKEHPHQGKRGTFEAFVRYLHTL